jgi:hypothetical protein
MNQSNQVVNIFGNLNEAALIQVNFLTGWRKR